MVTSIFPIFEKYKRQLIAVGFVLWGFYLRCRKFSHREFWLDEQNQLANTLHPFTSLWGRVEPGNDLTSFPGDYLLNYFFVKFFGFSKWAVVTPHIIVTLIGFYIFYLICQKYLKTIWGFALAFAVVCLNNQLIFHSFEIRPYAVLPTLALGCFYLLGELMEKYPSEISPRKKCLIASLLIITILFHLYGILIVFTAGVFHVMDQLKSYSLKDLFKRHYKFFGLVLLIAMPFWLWFSLAIVGVMGAWEYDTFEYIPNPLIDIIGFLKGVFCNLIGIRELYVAILGVVLSFFIAHQNRLRQMGFLLIVVIFPILCLLVADLDKKYFFVQRQFTWVMPLFAFFLGWCWDSVIVWAQRRFLKKA